MLLVNPVMATEPSMEFAAPVIVHCAPASSCSVPKLVIPAVVMVFGAPPLPVPAASSNTPLPPLILPFTREPGSTISRLAVLPVLNSTA